MNTKPNEDFNSLRGTLTKLSKFGFAPHQANSQEVVDSAIKLLDILECLGHNVVPTIFPQEEDCIVMIFKKHNETVYLHILEGNRLFIITNPVRVQDKFVDHEITASVIREHVVPYLTGTIQ